MKILKKLIAKIRSKKQAKKKDVEKKCEIELLNEMERIFDKYNENIIFKVHIGDDCEYIDIYSKNYKIGLKSLKRSLKQLKRKNKTMTIRVFLSNYNYKYDLLTLYNTNNCRSKYFHFK